MSTQTPSLSEQWSELLKAEPKLRIRDAAKRLCVSEAQLLATRVGNGVTRLAASNWFDFVKELPRLGRVMCLTRNEHAVHERYGKFRDVAFVGHGVGQVVGPDIDLRLFMSHWVIGFAVEDETPEGIRRSFQIFDQDGTATHKVYLTEESDLEAYNAIVAAYRSEDQSTEQAVTPLPPGRPERPDSAIDVESYHKAYLAMKDSHDFFMVMHRHGLAREQALRLAPEGYAYQVKVEAVEQMLRKASETDTPIMVFIGSEGCLQIHTGPVKNIKWFGSEWLNVLDEEFNMHLRASAIARAWVVKKPTAEEGVGYVTSLELFTEAGENVVLFFGKRKPGQPEDESWRQIISELPRL